MRSLFKLLARIERCTSGSALVEMTLVVPLAVALMAGAVDFGMGFSAQATLGKSVRDAARYVAGLPVRSCSNSTTYWANSYAMSLVTNVVPSASPSVTCSACPFDASSNCITATATLTYNSIILTGALPGYFPALGNFNLSARHQEVQIGGP